MRAPSAIASRTTRRPFYIFPFAHRKEVDTCLTMKARGRRTSGSFAPRRKYIRSGYR